MAEFLEGLLSLGIESGIALFSGKRGVSKVQEFLDRLINNQKVSAEEFLKMYNLRRYNMNTKQKDIKILKTVEIEGVYIIENVTKNKNYVGNSKNILKKVERHFSGYGKEQIYENYKNGDIFYISIERLIDWEFSDINLLQKEISTKFSAYGDRYL